MENIETYSDRIREYMEEKNAARDRALQSSRILIRHCSKAIRAVHRKERDLATKHIQEAQAMVRTLQDELHAYPDLYHAGYTQSALKEFAEASIVFALVGGEALPDPDDLNIEYSAYLGGMAEAAGELRRRTLDILRHDSIEEAERLLAAMDEIYGQLVTFDFPDAITGGLRRLTDMVRGVTERTRGDLTTSIQQRELRSALLSVERKLDRA